MSTATLPVLELPSISFFGRTFAEYAQFFSLDPARLENRAILDVAAGPSSFTAEACRRGLDAVAVDPLYGCPTETLATHVRLDYATMLAHLRARPELVRLRSFASLDEAEGSRRAAAERFLRDYDSGFVHGRYVGARLPHLPFFDGQFDLVLCAHLLFVYASRFDYAFHLAACVELARVSREEVRIHPLCEGHGRPYRELARLRRDLAVRGVESAVVPVDYEFFVGTRTMLVLKKTKSFSPLP